MKPWLIQRESTVGVPTEIAVQSPHTAFPCPTCGAVVGTMKHQREEVSPRGWRWTGVPCRGCGTFYTVELTNESNL